MVKVWFIVILTWKSYERLLDDRQALRERYNALMERYLTLRNSLELTKTKGGK